MALSAAEILAADDTQIEKVPIEAWGGDVIVRGMTGEERDAFEASLRSVRKSFDGKSQEMVLVPDNARAKLLVKCLVDESGERLYKDTDAPALGKKNGKILDQLYDVAAKLSGLSEEAKKEIEGNSEAGQTGNSSSSLPETFLAAP